MPQSYADLNVHLIFSTKGRAPSIPPEVVDRLYEYMGGTLRGHKCRLIAAGGVSDHVHLLVSLSREISIAEAMRVVKANSSKWMHETFPASTEFAWQNGYGAFSVSHSNIEQVVHYIRHQAEHHQSMTFQEEYLAFLRRHAIEFDERYVWD